MDAIRIRGGTPLTGRVRVSGAKNAALPILCSAILSPGQSTLRNAPNLRDIHTLSALLRFLGRHTEVEDGAVRVLDESGPVRPEAPYELVKQMRASVLVLGPLLTRYGRATVSLPGGCAIGARPIDQHLKGLTAMGARIDLDRGYVVAEGPSSDGGRLRGADFCFDVVSVTGTSNLMMAATLAKGRTILSNCAREPEVTELSSVLIGMGAQIRGAGSDEIQIDGVDSLNAFDHAVIADRIEAGTFMTAAAATGGDVIVEGAPIEHMGEFVSALQAAGCSIAIDGNEVRVSRLGPLHPVDITTAPYPGFPTDMQAQFMALMCLADGRSVITETIFENRFMHVCELARMGARIEVRGNTAIVSGVPVLCGASVMATDLRASASLLIAGLVAKTHDTTILRVYHLDRGYEHIERKLAGLGADVLRVKDARC
ncbi:MAG: UDP-N-acetylglucosamine 1-carboxyvinyltransferase [Polyangiaceae bacterium]|nr:UDP-N-acetylglucosamine 1-carboxyvinyltransferase [Polyangiaceae bacterium]